MQIKRTYSESDDCTRLCFGDGKIEAKNTPKIDFFHDFNRFLRFLKSKNIENAYVKLRLPTWRVSKKKKILSRDYRRLSPNRSISLLSNDFDWKFFFRLIHKFTAGGLRTNESEPWMVNGGKPPDFFSLSHRWLNTGALFEFANARSPGTRGPYGR